MKILIAPHAYKGTLSPLKVAKAIALGVKKARSDTQLVLLPLSDGGDGTIESLHYGLGGLLQETLVTGPLDQPVKATWLQFPALAVIELALTNGLGLLGGIKLYPLRAHTKGLGELIKHCSDEGISHLMVTLGGSASSDGGTGALKALGAKFLDGQGMSLSSGGGALNDLRTIDLSELSSACSLLSIDLALDVEIPLLGEQGAARVFAPQKGASQQEVEILEAGLKRLADVFEQLIGRSLRDLPGVGAAGGTAFGLAAGLNASLNSGFEMIAQMLDLSSKIGDCDLVISAEGRLDEQSLLGKGVGQLAKLCKTYKRPLWLIPASVSTDLDWSAYGIERLVASATNDRIANELDVIEAAERIFAK